MGQLKEKLLAASQEEIARVLKEAQDEALLEAKAMLKERMLEAILQDAIGKVNRLALMVLAGSRLKGWHLDPIVAIGCGPCTPLQIHLHRLGRRTARHLPQVAGQQIGKCSGIESVKAHINRLLAKQR